MTLTKNPVERPGAHQLLAHALFKEVKPSATLQERITQHIQERAERIAQEQMELAPAGTGTVRVKRGAEAPEWEFSMRRSVSQPVRAGPRAPSHHPEPPRPAAVKGQLLRTRVRRSDLALWRLRPPQVQQPAVPTSSGSVRLVTSAKELPPLPRETSASRTSEAVSEAATSRLLRGGERVLTQTPYCLPPTGTAAAG